MPSTTDWRILVQRDGRVWRINDDLGAVLELGTIEPAGPGYWRSRCLECTGMEFVRSLKREAVAALVRHWDDDDALAEAGNVSGSTEGQSSIAQSPTEASNGASND